MKKLFLISQLCIGLTFFACTKDVKEISQQVSSGKTSPQNVANTSTVLSTVYKGLTITFHDGSSMGTANSGRNGANIYDYSANIMVDGNMTRLYHGGRYLDATSDGDHILARKVVDTYAGNITYWNSSASWVQPTLVPAATVNPSAIWRQGEDVGWDPKIWDSGNYLEPECIKVDGTYYMFSQVEIRAGDYIDVPANEVAGPSSADRIRLVTSPNGEANWVRVFPNGEYRGVVINLPVADDQQIKLTHQEMIYEPGKVKPWVMYVFWQNNYVNQGHVRIRSATPHTFDWNDRKWVSGMSQLGNQVGYTDVPKTGGGTTRLYFRITNADDAGRRVPSFQFSSDGLTWEFGSTVLKLWGHPTLNNYFLGFSTVDGTGQLKSYGAANNYNILYASCASVGAGSADIWNSDIWLGKTQMQLTGTLTP